jgi:ABC-type multidrug transport system fused ATPase/permease subunit
MVKFEGFGKALNDSTKILNNINKIGKLFDKIGSKSIFNGFKKKRMSTEKAGEDFFKDSTSFGLKALKLPPIKTIENFFKPFSKVKSAFTVDKFIGGFKKEFLSLFTLISKGLNGLKLVLSKVIISIAPFLGTLTLIGAAAIFATKLLSTMWKVNTGGIQTSVNALRGKWRAGMAKMDISFIKLARALDPLIKPFSKFVELVASFSIDFLINSIVILVSALEYLANSFNVVLGGILIGVGKINEFLGGGSNIREYGEKMYNTGMTGLDKVWNPENQQAQTVTNNNITFNVGGSNMNEDAYMIFANRILQQIA